MDQVFQQRMVRLKDKLTLSPEQSQAIEKILVPQYRGAAETSAGIFAGKMDRETLAELRLAGGNGGHRDDQIRALLSPEQQTAYAAMKEEDAMNNARLAANGELIQMQNNLSLTTDQQDKVFAILYEQIHQQFKAESAGHTSAHPAEALRARHQGQMQALENVLTPGQSRDYQEQQERQIQFKEKIVAQMKAGMCRE